MHQTVRLLFVASAVLAFAGCGGSSNKRPDDSRDIVPEEREPPVVVTEEPVPLVPDEEVAVAVKQQVTQQLLASTQRSVSQPLARGADFPTATEALVFPPRSKAPATLSVLPRQGALIRAPGGKVYSYLIYEGGDTHSFEREGEEVAVTLPEMVYARDFSMDGNAASTAVATRLREIAAADLAGTAFNPRAVSVGGARGEGVSMRIAKEPRDVAEAECQRFQALLGTTSDCQQQPEEGEFITSRHTVDGYFYEGEYGGFGIWLANPQNFFGAGAFGFPDWQRQIFYYGLMTPAANVPTTGTARYSGIAAGLYLTHAGTVGGDPGDRFVVAGDVHLEADFAAQEIGGDVFLRAFHHHTLAAEEGHVDIVLRGGTFDAADPARFSGEAEITSAEGTLRSTTHYVLRGVELPASMGVGSFDGMLAGPRGEEAVGKVHFATDFGRNLEFGFITRQE